MSLHAIIMELADEIRRRKAMQSWPAEYICGMEAAYDWLRMREVEP